MARLGVVVPTHLCVRAATSSAGHEKRRASPMLDSENAPRHLQCWHRWPYIRTLPTVAQVSFTVDADMQLLRRTVGLCARIKRAVLDVLEAALEIDKLGMGQVHKDAPLILRVDAHLVTYSLDLESESATISGAEPVRQAVA